MPKKFAGENSKAVVAKARKEAVRKDQQLKKQQQAEEEYWKDDDKQIVKKQQRKVCSLLYFHTNRVENEKKIEQHYSYISTFRKKKRKRK